MKKIYFTVGPSQLYPTVNKHLTKALTEYIPSLSHRGKEFKKLFKNTSASLKKLLKIPQDYQVFYVSSALECMERIIQGCCYQNSYHIITGNFGKAWANYAQQLGKNTILHNTIIGEDLSRIIVPVQAEIICITQNDTSTGVWISPKFIDAIKKKYPDKLIAVDIVSSVPFVDLNYKNIDLAFFSVQKGFGLPAGLAVLIVSPQALKKTEQLIKRGVNIGSYHSLKNLSEKAAGFQTPETPNVLNIYLLNKVIKDMQKEKIKQIRKEIIQKAKLLYEYFDKHKRYKPAIKNPDFQSPTTAVFDVSGESEKIRKKLEKSGFIVGAGYGDNKLNHIRIANFPTHQLKDIKRMLKYIA